MSLRCCLKKKKKSSCVHFPSKLNQMIAFILILYSCAFDLSVTSDSQNVEKTKTFSSLYLVPSCQIAGAFKLAHLWIPTTHLQSDCDATWLTKYVHRQVFACTRTWCKCHPGCPHRPLRLGRMSPSEPLHR